MQSKIAKELLKKFSDNKEHYRVSEVWTWTQDFVRDVFNNVFWLRPVARFLHQKDLFWNDLADNIYQQELKKSLWNETRADFLCKINWKKVVVEVEAFGWMEKWIKQIKWYIEKENTNYALVTDWYEWRFYNNWYSEDPSQYRTLTLEELLSEKWNAFIQNHYNTYNHYISRLENIIQKEFNLQDFHKGLIITAESLVYDFKYSWLFTQNVEASKLEIQTSYSLIIQFILLKIIQDKKGIQLIKKNEILWHLKDQNYWLLFKIILDEVKRLGNFYESYHNQQVNLIDKIIKHYSDENNLQNFSLDTVRPFLDLYQFIFSFNFKNVKQDLFGAVYENYLKELYREDGTKKWQVFTPPEIVDFMLDQIWYTVEFIKETISNNLDKSKLLNAKDSCNYNIPWLSIIDPACWSWTFLYKASGRIVNAIHKLKEENKITESEAGILSENLIINNVVWFDIEAFPLYLAEMNILQALLFFNVWPKGEIVNQISNPIKIFSTNDSIAEFHNLEQWMEDEIRKIIENHWFERDITSKRDSSSILWIKADLQDFDQHSFKEKIIIWIYLKELQRPIYVSQWKELIGKNPKSFREEYQKKIKVECLTTKELFNFVKSKDENIFLLFKKNITAKNPYIKQISNKIDEVFSKEQSKRIKFDFVIANPPYIACDEIPKSVKENRKNIWIEMSNVFWINLHSIPSNRKKYPPKPNLYFFFNALAYFLLKPNGRTCFIVPEWFVNYDCNNRFLANKVTLSQLFFFNDRVFVNRWLLWNIETATSAMIFLYKKTENNDNYNIDIHSFDKKQFVLNNKLDITENIEIWTILKNLIHKSINSNELYGNIEKWFSIFKESTTTLEFVKKYEKNSYWMEIYYDHDNNQKPVADKFIFDVWFTLKDEYLSSSNDCGYFYLNWKDIRNYTLDFDNLRKYPNDKEKILLTKNSQWYSLLDNKYYLVVSIKYPTHFAFSDQKIIFKMWTASAIWSDNYQEILYLFWILNSSVNRQIFELDRLEWWRFGLLIATTTIKKKIRVPKIDSENKEALKKQLIENSERIINLCKNGGVKIETRWDICDTQIDMNNMNETIIWVKKEYKEVLKWVDVDIMSISKEDILPEEIKEKIGTVSIELKKLEEERDRIVSDLYELN